MRLTFAQVAHTLRSNLYNFVSDLRMIPFTIMLKINKWRYGGAKNIPPEKIRLLLTQTPEEERALKFAVCVHSCAGEVANWFKLPEERRQLELLIAHYFTSQIEDVELNNAVGVLIYKKPLRKAIYKAMRACGDITDDDLQIFQSENDWKEFVEWLNEPISKHETE